ncbi:MAG TPA: VTT domain-containing protein [Gemmatimonadaceae bacterium]|nr:VTT domain-containing protein [Gemmatimonadaceae bacterium]
MTFLERMWAYVTLGAMGLVWEEVSPLLGGLAAHDRNLALVSVIGAVALGTWIAGLGVYFLGRWRGRWIWKRWPGTRRVILNSIAIVRRHPWRASLLARFAYGLRIAVLLACGAGRVPLRVYALGTAVSCLVWSLGFTLLGWVLGRTTERVLGQVQRFEPILGAVMIAAVALAAVWLHRSQVGDRTAEVLDRET